MMEDRLLIWMIDHKEAIQSGNITDELKDEYNKIISEEWHKKFVDGIGSINKISDMQMRQYFYYGFGMNKRISAISSCATI